MTIPFGRPNAVARISGNNDAPCMYGTVKFYEIGRGVLVVADICGLPKSETGIFAMHIHGDDAERCKSDQYLIHTGNLPPLVSCGGSAFASVMTDRFRVLDVIGKTLVIYNEPDHYGKAGKNVACGIVSER